MDHQAIHKARGAVVTGLLLLFAGCVYAPTAAQRSASFAPYAATRIRGQPAEEFLRDRFAFIAAVNGPLPAESDLEYTPLMIVGLGSAAAVDRHGYFVTAAHCVAGPGPFYLIKIAADGKIHYFKARIVWKGDQRGLDFALLSTRFVPAGAFEWAESFHVGEPLIAVGLYYQSLSGLSGLLPDYFAGRLLGSADLHDGPVPGQIVFYEGPGHQGDSGGPLVTPDGRLVGLTVGDVGALKLGETEYRVPLVPLKSRAVRPDLEWMRRTIEEDRAAHKQ